MESLLSRGESRKSRVEDVIIKDLGLQAQSPYPPASEVVTRRVLLVIHINTLTILSASSSPSLAQLSTIVTLITSFSTMDYNQKP